MTKPKHRRKANTRLNPNQANRQLKPDIQHLTPVLWLCLALILLNVIVYAPVWHHEFVNYDDLDYVSGNPNISNGLTWRAVVWAFSTGYFSNWHPLTWLSHMLDVQMYGFSPGLHHLTSLVLHTANTILLFGLLRRMTGALGRSAFVAGLFAVHPLHVESVAWVAERKDVLSTLFWILTLWGYAWYIERPRLRRYLAVLALFALGLMAKPMLVTLPFVLLLMDYWPLGRIGDRERVTGDTKGVASVSLFSMPRSVLLEKIPLVALAIASSIVTLVVQRRGGAIVALEMVPLSRRAANAMVSYAAYIGKMVWPGRLAAFYPYPPSLAGWQVIGALLLLILISVVAIRGARRHKYLPVGWLWYVGTLLPVIGLVQVGDQSMADRYTYIPLIGLFIIVAWGVPDLLSSWPRREMVLASAAAIVLLACMITARHQVRYWQNSIVLWEHALGATVGNYVAHYTLGVALAQQGRVNEAAVHYVSALQIKPDYALAHTNLGGILLSQGNLSEAIRHNSEALRARPDLAEAHNNLGVALAGEGKVDEAIQQFLQALQIKPDEAPWHYNLAVLFGRKGNAPEMIRHLETALKLNPNYEDAQRLLNDVRSSNKPGSHHL